NAHCVLRSEDAPAAGVGPVLVFGGNYNTPSNTNTPFASIAGVKAIASTSSTEGRLVFSVSQNGSSPIERMSIGHGYIRLTGISTTASAANAFLDSGAGNSILRSTSSLKYKKDIEPLSDEE